MLFLVTGEVSINEYMEDGDKIESFMELVEADSVENAIETMEVVYEEKSSDYGTNYSVNWCNASCPIRQRLRDDG